MIAQGEPIVKFGAFSLSSLAHIHYQNWREIIIKFGETRSIEFLDLILSVKTADSLEDAIAHINRYSTIHSDAIITEDYANARAFLDKVDSACAYVIYGNG